MAFGPIMKLQVGDLQIELAPLTKEAMGEFVSLEHGGGMQLQAVTRYISRQFAPVLEDEHDWFEKVRLEATTLLWGIWVIEKDRRILIGNTSIFKIGKIGHAPFIRQAETGSMIFRQDYWGKGIASAVHKARTWYAFKHLGLHCLQSAVLQPNIASRKALEKAGYLFTHSQRNKQYSNGELTHLDYLECPNPIGIFWDQWWHKDTPTAEALTAKKLLEANLEWAEKNVKF